MKYIAIFDVPDGYAIGCALAKMAIKGKEVYQPEDSKNVYAQVEPLSDKGAEVLERFNAVERVLQDLGLGCAYDMPSFWTNGGKDYKIDALLMSLDDNTRDLINSLVMRTEVVILPSAFDPRKQEEQK